MIRHSWGSCWGLKFCPYGAYGNGRVGLLAGVFDDGIVRVIDVRREWLGKDEMNNVSISEAAWEFSVAARVGGGAVDIIRLAERSTASTCLKA